ncbi:hypothetical protein LXG23DRAFT_51263 [Yarrowia lipolytica]|nr:hypothetical protein BKA91DRAFT_104256 [Yarrowia lipolytica]KAE8173978.1 hypothetical protein BKA90DRAFT_159312 [Yarrowia lipolytica]KAJ8051720.1 hypothetical protein LXG23DRAFT_51263 [Yarrowia lipolytica]RMI95242.1 hypothetical protein BD777DRAFT_105634 [Yarrowia lipolytica]SEI35879.1 YALIA101S09e00606g1_1 [Yarrowia lipolytica]
MSTPDGTRGLDFQLSSEPETYDLDEIPGRAESTTPAAVNFPPRRFQSQTTQRPPSDKSHRTERAREEKVEPFTFPPLGLPADLSALTDKVAKLICNPPKESLRETPWKICRRTWPSHTQTTPTDGQPICFPMKSRSSRWRLLFSTPCYTPINVTTRLCLDTETVRTSCIATA